MSRRNLHRMVVRIDPTLLEALTGIAERLFTETQLDYSRAATLRGLITLGLSTVVQAPHLASLFVGARVNRGRKPGGPPEVSDVPPPNGGRFPEKRGRGGER